MCQKELYLICPDSVCVPSTVLHRSAFSRFDLLKSLLASSSLSSCWSIKRRQALNCCDWCFKWSSVCRNFTCEDLDIQIHNVAWRIVNPSYSLDYVQPIPHFLYSQPLTLDFQFFSHICRLLLSHRPLHWTGQWAAEEVKKGQRPVPEWSLSSE